MRKQLILVLMMLGLQVMACTALPAGSQESLDGNWQLVTLDGAAVLPDYPISFTVEDGQVSGHAGCNLYDGTINVDGDSLSFGPIARTEMACADQTAMKQESDYFAVLLEVNGYQFDETGQLRLLDADGTSRLVFVPSEGMQATLESNPISPTATADIIEPTQIPVSQPPTGFIEYQDLTAGVSIYIPESWVVTGVIDGEYAIFQSYPEDKYIGGEAFEPGDTKCDMNIRPSDVDLASYMQQITSSPTFIIISEAEITLSSGQPATRLEVDSMGLSNSLITEINDRVVVLTCFGELAVFDEIAFTLAEVK